MNEPLPIPLPTSVLDEYQLFTSGAGYINFSDRSRIEITGSDRSNFLHSFCTNDINALTPGTGCEAFLCNPKGKIVGHVAVFCHSDRLVLDAAANQAAALIEHLSRYIIMEDVHLADCSATQSRVFICGAQAHAVLKRVIGHDLPQTAWSHCESRTPAFPAVCYSVPFLRQPGFLLATATEHFESLLSCLRDHGLVKGQQATWEVLRIESGWPQYGTDISQDNLPQELGRDVTAINFNKGCYLGQETVARVDAVGHVNRRLVQIDCKSPSPVAAQAILTHDERAVGVVTSTGYSPKQQGAIALGYLQQTLAKPGQSLTVESRTVVIMNVLNS